MSMEGEKTKWAMVVCVGTSMSPEKTPNETCPFAVLAKADTGETAVVVTYASRSSTSKARDSDRRPESLLYTLNSLLEASPSSTTTARSLNATAGKVGSTSMDVWLER